MAGPSDRRRSAPATVPVDRTGPMRPEPATPGDSVAGLELPQAVTSELRRRLTRLMAVRTAVISLVLGLTIWVGDVVNVPRDTPAYLVLLERWIHRHLQGIWLLLFRSPDVATVLYAVVMLPGVPVEMRNLLAAHVLPRLADTSAGGVIRALDHAAHGDDLGVEHADQRERHRREELRPRQHHGALHGRGELQREERQDEGDEAQREAGHRAGP